MSIPLPPLSIERIASAKGALAVDGAPEGVDVSAFAASLERRGGVGLFVARDEARASAAEAAAAFFSPTLDIIRLPGWDNLPYDRISPSPAVAAQRCAVLARLAARQPNEKPLLVIATASAVAQRVPPRARMGKGAFEAKVGEYVELEVLQAYFDVNGYGRASTVRAPGEFAQVGYVDPAAFRRIYRRYAGETPTASRLQGG